MKTLKNLSIQKPRTVFMKAIAWSFDEIGEGKDKELVIDVSGLNENNQSVYTRILGFQPYVYLQLPEQTSVNYWTMDNYENTKNLFAFLKEKAYYTCKPLSCEYSEKFLFKEKEPMRCLKLNFKTHSACRDFANFCKRRMPIPKLDNKIFNNNGANLLTVHEASIDPIIKYTANTQLEMAGWMKIVEFIPEDDRTTPPKDRKFSSSKINLFAKHDNIQPIQQPNLTSPINPTYCSFDLECYSKNHNSKLPDPIIPENKVIQIAMQFGNLIQDDNPKVIVLSLGNPKDIKGAKVIRFKEESDLLLKFVYYIRKYNPDTFIGHNIIKFDWNYLLIRAEGKGTAIFTEFLQGLSRLFGIPAKVASVKWQSRAFKEQIFKYPECMRPHIDTLADIEKNYRLATYSLNAVSKRFLEDGDQKEDVSAREIFMIHKITCDTSFITRNPTEKQLQQAKEIANKILVKRQLHKPMRIWRRDILSATTATIYEILRHGMTIMAIYCKGDTRLPVKLTKVLCIYETMEQMANTFCVPLSSLSTRGQGYKVLGQLYRELINENMVMNARGQRPEVVEKYQGATVIEAHPGHYKNVICEDFASLYPSIMILLNICPSTFVDCLKNPKPHIPDSECNIVEGECHVGCSHDPLRRKKKAEDVLCGRYRNRFRKVKLSIGENGELVVEDEGIMPKVLRNSLAKRSAVKKQMAEVEATLKMHDGKATDDDLAYYKNLGYKIIPEGSLDEKQKLFCKIDAGSKNAKQLAIKVGANSAYGVTGAPTSDVYNMRVAESVTGTGRFLISQTNKKIKEMFPPGSKDECKLVYGDTDSSQIMFPGKTLDETFVLGELVSKRVTHYLKCLFLNVPEDYKVGKWNLFEINPKHPEFHTLSNEDKLKVYEYCRSPLNLEFENVYETYLLLSKKRYMAKMVNKNGKSLGDSNKGVVLARRDNCEYLRSTYKQTKNGVLQDKEKKEIYYGVYDRVSDLFTSYYDRSSDIPQVKDQDLTIYVGVSDLIGYATKSKISKQNIEVYVDEHGKEFEPAGPLDPRLVYSNIPQVLLCKKMLQRGTEVPPNTRLEFLYTINRKATHQGEKAEDFTYYQENKHSEGLKPDKIHYIEKQLCKPLTEILSVKYPGEIVIYKKLEDALKEAMENPFLDLLKKQRLLKTRVHERYIFPIEGDEVVGWDALGIEHNTNTLSKFLRNLGTNISKCYKYSGLDAKVELVLDSCKKNKPNEFNYEEDGELIELCKRWRSRRVLNAIYTRYGLRKRDHYKPTQRGVRIPVETTVILACDIGEHKKGEEALIVKRYDERKKEKIFHYDLMFSNNECDVLRNVERSTFDTFYRRDHFVMRDILNARKGYMEVVEELKMLCSPLVINDEYSVSVSEM